MKQYMLNLKWHNFLKKFTWVHVKKVKTINTILWSSSILVRLSSFQNGAVPFWYRWNKKGNKRFSVNGNVRLTVLAGFTSDIVLGVVIQVSKEFVQTCHPLVYSYMILDQPHWKMWSLLEEIMVTTVNSCKKNITF